MTQPANESRSPSLFAHKNRKDWGVGVLAWEADGKRGYLFDNGEERTMASGYFELMGRVEHPSAEEKAIWGRLQRILAARANAHDSARRGATFADHVERFREAYPEGLQDAKWLVEVRGEGAGRRAPRHRDAMVREATEQLSSAALDALIGSQKYEQVWSLVTSVLSRTDLVPAAQLRKPKSPTGEQRQGLAVATRDLLHGKTPYEQRFEHYLRALAGFLGEPPRWEIATALSALVHATDHVCVNPTIFRQHVKATGSRGSIASRPSQAAYARLLDVARSVSSQLIGQGEVPRDLLDVLDFMRIAFKPAATIRVARAPAGRKARSPSGDDDSAGNDDTSSNDDD
jgi:hypothetical protein